MQKATGMTYTKQLYKEPLLIMVGVSATRTMFRDSSVLLYRMQVQMIGML